MKPLILGTIVILVLLLGIGIGHVVLPTTVTTTTTQTSISTSTVTSITTSSITTTTSTITVNPNLTKVGAYYYLWYGFNETSLQWTGGLHTSHWNDSIYGIVKDKPSIGYYASDSNTTLANQIPEMLDAGINFVIVSWWGWGNTRLQSGGPQCSSPSTCIIDAAINNATLNLLKWIQANNSSMKVAIMVDAFNETAFGDTQYA